MIDVLLNGLLITCSSLLFKVDVGFENEKLMAQVKDARDIVLVESEVKASIKGYKWDLKCIGKDKCSADLDLKKDSGILKFKTKSLDVETNLKCN